MFDPDIERALRASLEAHQGQTRKGAPDVPYVSHPFHIALMLAQLGVESVVIQAALLHDVVEDCDGWTEERVGSEFGADVASLVGALTDPTGKSWELRKEHGIEGAASMDLRAATIKAADKLHNLSSLVAAVRAAPTPEDAWRPFSRGAAQTIAMSRRLVDTLAARVDARLGAALSATMAELETLSEASE